VFIVNHNKKIGYWSKGKLGTTTLRLMVPTELHGHGRWEILDESNSLSYEDATVINWDIFKDYVIYCPIRSPRSRYYSGLIEDVYTFYRCITGNKSSYDLSELSYESDWHNTINHLYSISMYDMSLGLSYHVSNWLYEIVYLYRKNLNVHVFEMSEWNKHYKEHYNLEQTEIINENPKRIKEYVKNYFGTLKNPYVSGIFENYIKTEEEIYNTLKNNLTDTKLSLDETQLKALSNLLTIQVDSFVSSSSQVFSEKIQRVLELR